MMYVHEVKLLHVLEFFGHLQGDIERRKSTKTDVIDA